MFRGSATYFLAHERVAAHRRARSDELLVLYQRADSLPDAPDAREGSAWAGGVGAGLGFLLRQLMRRVTPSPR
jgi:hypothetical protein